MLKRFGLTTLLTILGGLLGLGLAIAFVWDWFDSSWQQIENAPEPVAKLIHIEQDQVWVESEAGILYKYNDPEHCQSDCWMAVKSIPDPVWHDDPNLMEIKDITCSPALPILGIEERIEQCRVEMWVSKNYVFVLGENGSISFWQSDVFGEWLVIELFLGLCAGATCLFIPSILFILFPEILRRILKQRNTANAEQ